MLSLLFAAALPVAELPALPTIDALVNVEGAALAVSMALPSPGLSPRPGAVLILPGSGPSTRADTEAIGEPFRKAGLAVVTFDKRGCGSSSGSWLKASLDDSAADGREILKWIKSRAEIDAKRIGLVGASQGGWVAPLIAAASSDVAFVVALTGGGITPRVTETFDYERRLADASVTGADLVAARTTIDAYFSYLAGTTPLSSVESLLASGKTRGWADALGINRVLPDEKLRPFWSWVATFDPLVSVRKLKMPVLVMIGGRDRDPSVEVRAWQDGLVNNGDPRTEIRVIPDAGHVLTIGGNHMSRQFNAKAVAAMAAWAASASVSPGA